MLNVNKGGGSISKENFQTWSNAGKSATYFVLHTRITEGINLHSAAIKVDITTRINFHGGISQTSIGKKESQVLHNNNWKITVGSNELTMQEMILNQINKEERIILFSVTKKIGI